MLRTLYCRLPAARCRLFSVVSPNIIPLLQRAFGRSVAWLRNHLRGRDYLKEFAPWTKLFSAFKIALDPKKLVLAGTGVLVMALGWYLLSSAFFAISSERPEWNTNSYPDMANSELVKRDAAWQAFKRDRHRWYLLYELAGTPPVKKVVINIDKDKTKDTWVPEPVVEDNADLVNTLQDYEIRQKTGAWPRAAVVKPYGRFLVMPWFEDRGPNPYLLVTGKSQNGGAAHPGARHDARERFVDWLLHDQMPVLLEPLFKFLLPVIHIFDPAVGFWNHLYLFLVILWSLATWAFFGGAITCIAAVQVARPNERVSLNEAVKFVVARYKAYLTAPLFPLVFLAVLTVVLFIFGLLEVYLFAVGDIVFPLLWPIVLLVALIMAVVLVGLVGWPLMYATISVEGSDSFDAISRSYSYVYQSPWQYLWYSLVAVVYGAILVFFVGFMGSLLVYLGKWAVTLPPTPASREPSYLFTNAPTSFGWRNLLLYKSPHAETLDETNHRGRTQPVTRVKFDDNYQFAPSNRIGAFLVSVWLYLLFLLIVGFGYSYFWTASTIIYLLMRQKVDDTEMDEVHLEEEPEQPFPSPMSSSPVAGDVAKGQATLQMVEPPQMRPAAVVTPGSPGPSSPSPSASPISPPPSAEPARDKPRGDGPAIPGGLH